MQFKMTNWDLSNIVVEQDVPLSEGEHTLYIERANYDSNTTTMSIKFRSLSKEGEASMLSYTVFDNKGEPNKYSIGTLNSLKHALAGPDSGDGILFAGDIIHGVVKATVKMSKPYTKQDGSTVTYPNIYHFEPVTSEEYELIKMSEETIEQYVKE